MHYRTRYTSDRNGAARIIVYYSQDGTQRQRTMPYDHGARDPHMVAVLNVSGAVIATETGRSDDGRTRTYESGTHNGHANRESYQFDLVWSNNQAMYEATIAYVRELLRRLPSMTQQTIGRNIKDHVMAMVAIARGEMQPTEWDRPFMSVPAKDWRELADAVGDLRNLSESEIGESAYEAATGQ